MSRVIFFLGLMLLPCCSIQRPTSLHVPLLLKISDPGAPMAGLPATPVYVLAVNDLRQELVRIGENRQQDPAIPVYPDGESVPEFFHDTLSSQLAHAGLTIVANPNDAQRVISVNLTTFWAVESPGYYAKIAADIQVRDLSGKPLWSKVVVGLNPSGGQSLRVENYQQVLGNAMVDLVHNMVNDNSFRAAVGGTILTTPSPTTGPGTSGQSH